MYSSDIPGSKGEMTAGQLRMNVENGGAGREVTLRRINKGMRPTHGAQNRTEGVSTAEIVRDVQASHAAHFRQHANSGENGSHGQDGKTTAQ